MVANVLTIEGGDPQAREAAARNLNETVIPQLQQAPGFVAAYWLTGGSGKRLTVAVWEDAQSLEANEAQMKDRREQTLSEFGMRITSMERYEVVAHGEKAKAHA
jgi:hypothetical protein